MAGVDEKLCNERHGQVRKDMKDINAALGKLFDRLEERNNEESFERGVLEGQKRSTEKKLWLLRIVLMVIGGSGTVLGVVLGFMKVLGGK